MYICDKVIFGRCSLIFLNNFVIVVWKIGDFYFKCWIGKSFWLVDLMSAGTSHPIFKDSLSTVIRWKVFETGLEKKTIVFRLKNPMWIKTIVKLFVVSVITKQKPNTSWLRKDVSVAPALTMTTHSISGVVIEHVVFLLENNE